MSHDRKVLKRALAAARAAGWRVEQTRSHYRFLSPDGKTIVMMSASIADHRAMQNQIGHFRRGGLVI